MDSSSAFTAAELLSAFLYGCGAITATAAALAVLASFVSKLKAPNKAQDVRLDEHDKRIKRIEGLLDGDNRRLKSLEEGNRITMKALLALLRHGIDGNDTTGMKKVEGELQEYLTENR